MTSKRVINFAAGPSALPEAVLKRIQDELLNYKGCGYGVMEMSHRSKEFLAILKNAEKLFREILSIPENFKVMFMHGGGTGQFSAVPLNLCDDGGESRADYVVSGIWSSKAAIEGENYCKVNRMDPRMKQANSTTTLKDQSTWGLNPEAAYLYYCDNETVHGFEFPEPPTTSSPLVSDMSSNLFTRPIDFSRYGCIIAGAQKNCGIAGLVFVIVRDDLIGTPMKTCPAILNYEKVSQAESLYNTPATFPIYVTGVLLEWIKENGGIQGMASNCACKSKMIYDIIDNSNGFYHSAIDPAFRSRVTIPFRVGGVDGNVDLEAAFLEQATKRNMIQLKGHRSVGGIRAALYNAITISQAEVLANFMREFMAENQK